MAAICYINLSRRYLILFGQRIYWI